MTNADPQDAAANEALRILDEAGVDNYSARHLAAAWRNLNLHIERRQREHAEAEKVAAADTRENDAYLTYDEWQVAHVIMSREGQKIRPVTLAGSEHFPSRSYSEEQVAEIMARYEAGVR